MNGVTHVDPLVDLQPTRPAKRFTAHITHKGFMTRMDTHVVPQGTSQRKRLTAHITRKGFMTSVDNNVLFQAILRGKSLTTHMPQMLSGFVCVPVTFPVTRVTARSGGVWTHSLQFLTMGRSHVCFQTAEVNENSRAVLTHMRSVQG